MRSALSTICIALAILCLVVVGSIAKTEEEAIKHICELIGKTGVEFENCVVEETERTERINKIFACRDNPRPLIGMDRDAVIELCGAPYRKKIITTENGTREQWVFTSDQVLFIYFDNGVVTGVESGSGQ